MNNNPPANNNSFSDDEIDIRQLLKVIWDGKIIIVAITSFFSIVAVIYSLSLPNIYQSKALLSPVGDEGSSSQMSNLGGLASLAGFEVSSQGGGNSAKAMEKLRTLSFFQDNIMPNIFLPDLSLPNNSKHLSSPTFNAVSKLVVDNVSLTYLFSPLTHILN